MLEPSHAKPAGHLLHAVRAVAVPPEVNDAGGHTVHLDAWFSLYRWSAPQSVQPPFSERYVPARQNTHCDAPLSDVAPRSHGKHVDAPEMGEYIPAAHSSTTLVPSHAEPIGQRLHVVR